MEEEKEKVAMNIVFIYACYLRLFTYRLLTPRLLTTTTIIWIAPMIVGDSLIRYHDHLDCSNDRWYHHRRPLVGPILSDTDSDRTETSAPFSLIHDHLDCSNDRLIPPSSPTP